jgi:hypothetical protein
MAAAAAALLAMAGNDVSELSGNFVTHATAQASTAYGLIHRCSLLKIRVIMWLIRLSNGLCLPRMVLQCGTLVEPHRKNE